MALKFLESGNVTARMGMMSKMMGWNEKKNNYDAQLMMDMMPGCLEMRLSSMPKEKRVDFVMKMAAILMEQGCVGMSDEEKKDFMAKMKSVFFDGV